VVSDDLQKPILCHLLQIAGELSELEQKARGFGLVGWGILG
jgi:hypothetical protein